ncbi:MAG: glycosyltransferase [Sphingobacteriales bacterium]|nr:glycosyltransferase [Sphingobacteriales bacterium]
MLSIVTPVRNGGKFIRKNIEEIQKLNIPIEHIISDGGSKDDTLKIVSEYPHLKLVHQSVEKGMYGGINEGFAVAQGKYFSYVNCDDLIEVSGFTKMYNKISSGDLDLVYSNSIQNYVNEGRKEFIRGARFARYFLKKGVMPFVQPSSIFSRRIFEKLEGFNSQKFRIIGDMDFFRRIATTPGTKIARVNDTSSVFLKYGESLGDLNNDLYYEELKQIDYKLDIKTKILFKIAKLT